MEGKSIYQKLDREPSDESVFIARMIDGLGTISHAYSVFQLKRLGWKVDCWEFVSGKWRKG